MYEAVRIRVLEGHYRDRVFVPAGTILELPVEQARAMLNGGTAELAPRPVEVNSPPARRVRDVFTSLFVAAKNKISNGGVNG